MTSDLDDKTDLWERLKIIAICYKGKQLAVSYLKHTCLKLKMLQNQCTRLYNCK